MPVRKIGLCYRSVSGRVPMGEGRPTVLVESTLERDFALLCRFDPMIAGIEEQPIRIQYRDADGTARSYVPDFLVSYRDGRRARRLVEVKYSTDPMLVSGQLEERFAAARAYARRQGWRFEVETEREIRTPRLENITFLLPFRDRTVTTDLRAELLAVLASGASMSIQESADAIAQSLGLNRVQVLPALWTMVARGEVSANIDMPLTMNSLLHLAKEKQP